MGRKSRKSCLIKPFCYFCLREFDNEKILIQHQKAKHFKCSECNRKLETANGLLVHMQQVHKMVQKRVPNALEGRDNIASSIQGMNGVPVEVIEEHRLQHIQKLTNLNKQKQQRINWTQINAPKINPSVNLGANGSDPLNVTNGHQNGPGVPMVGMALSQNLPMTMSANFSTNRGNEAPSGTLLVLDPNGMPIQKPVQQPVQNLPQNRIAYKTSGHSFSSSGGFSEAPPVTTVTSGIDGKGDQVTGVKISSGAAERILENLEDTGCSTTFYKATGMPPLHMQTPSLGSTKLAYSSDTVSIEELRAKMKFNWQETLP